PARAPSTRTIQTGPMHPTFDRAYGAPSYPLRVAVVPGGRLATDSGAVLDAAGRVVDESIWDEFHLQRVTPALRRPPRPRRISGRHASLMSLWCRNYFHWIFNSLPKLEVLAASGVEWETLIVPDQLAPFQLATLELLGIGPERLTQFDGGHLEVEDLVW